MRPVRFLRILVVISLALSLFSTTGNALAVSHAHDLALTLESSLTVAQGGQVLIDSGLLQAGDPASVFTLVRPPVRGQLNLDGAGLAAGDTFTQADVDTGKLAYVNAGWGSGPDSIGLTYHTQPNPAGVQIASDAPGALGAQGYPSVSLDGHWVAFTSASSTQVGGDTNGKTDVFVRNTWTGTVTRVSVSSTGTQANGDSSTPAISQDGRWVAFASYATNLATGSKNGIPNLFLRDLQNGTTRWVAALGSSSLPSRVASFSAGNRWMAFVTTDGLVATDHNGLLDVYRMDLQSGDLVRVSLASNGSEPTGDSSWPAISQDGSRVVFVSLASNLVSGDTNGKKDVFLADLSAGTLRLVSAGTDGNPAAGSSLKPAISADGGLVVFESKATNLFAAGSSSLDQIYLYDVAASQLSLITSDADGKPLLDANEMPSISNDGLRIAYTSKSDHQVSGDSNGSQDVFVYDRSTGQRRLISAEMRAYLPFYDGYNALISGDGQVLLYNGDHSGTYWGTAYSGPVLVYPLDAYQEIKLEVSSAGSLQLPVLGLNQTLHLGRGMAFPVLNSYLQVSDADSPAQNLVYTLESLPVNGTLRRMGTELAVGDTFTQADIVDLKLIYTHNGQDLGQDQFSFHVEDSAAPRAIQRVSVRSDGTRSGYATVSDQAVSGDGRYVAFVSDAMYVIPEVQNPTRIALLYLQDTWTGQTILVSKAADGTPADTAVAHPALTFHAEKIVFETRAKNLDALDTSGTSNIFMYDAVVGKVQRLSVSSAMGRANGDSVTPQVSSDGKKVVFRSCATNLSGLVNPPGPVQNCYDCQIYLLDLTEQMIRLVSHNMSGDSSQGYTSDPAISADGNWVVFASTGSDLVAGDTNGMQDIFLWDGQQDHVARVSFATNGLSANGESAKPKISQDGKSIVYESKASNLTTSDTNQVADIFLYTREDNKIQRVNLSEAGQQANAASANAAISADGRWIAFDSSATNLIGEEVQLAKAVYSLYLPSKTLLRLPPSPSFAQANLNASQPSLSAQGESLVFLMNGYDLDGQDWHDRSGSGAFIYHQSRISGTFHIVIGERSDVFLMIIIKD